MLSKKGSGKGVFTMDSRRFRNVFLSRASTEFGDSVNPIRTAALGNYEMLDVSDQLFPPAERDSLTAEATVRHLREWIERVDAVLQFVGNEAGSAWKVPDGGLDNLLRLLDPSIRSWLLRLVQCFQENNLSENDLTYTHLEGVMAIAQGKQPWILWLTDTGNKAIEPSQLHYRNWLKKNYLSGRDRCDANSIGELVLAAHRKLGEWNERTRIERLARNTHEVAIWDNVFDLSQPGIEEREVFRRWKQLLRYEGDTSVDWIKQRTVCGTPESMMIHRAHRPLLKWINPMDGKVGILARLLDGWKYEETLIDGHAIAFCQDSGDFHLLVENIHSGYQIVSTNRATCLPISGLQSHHFGTFRIWKTEDGFCLESGGQFWRLDTGELSASRTEGSVLPYEPNEQEQIDSGLVPQFARPNSFPFRRRFRGSTFDYERSDLKPAEGSVADEPWGLIEWKGILTHLVMNRGDFTDVFKMVDVCVPGISCLTKISLFRHTYWLQLKCGLAYHYLPLFPAPNPAPQYLLTQLPIDSQDASLLRNLTVSRSIAKNDDDSVAQPFCFIGRDTSGDVDKATRLRVWLIPAFPTKGLLSKLNDRICGLAPLYETPIRRTYQENDLKNDLGRFSDEWWDDLWANCSASRR